MGSNSKLLWNAEGRGELLWFDPENLTIVEDQEHVLRDPDRLEAPLDEAMVLNIMALGVKEPVIVRLNGKDKNDTPIVEVVDGRNRVRWAREANKRIKKAGGDLLRVPGIRTQGQDHDMLAIMIALNVIRKEETPLSKARKAIRYMALGRSEEETAVVFGVSRATIKNWTQLMECDTSVQKAVESGELAASNAMKLATLPRAEQKEALKKMQANGATKGRAASAAVERAAGRDTGKPAAELPTRPQLKRLLVALEEAQDPPEVSAASMLGWILHGKRMPIELRTVWKEISE